MGAEIIRTPGHREDHLMPLLRARIPFDHFPFAAGALAAVPTPRYAVSIYATTSTEPVSPDYAARYISELTILVKDPTLFGNEDEVDIGGRRFSMDMEGADGDWRNSSVISKYSRLLGGEIRVKRVG
ncbi:hypothetical protein BH09ACT7_BH09ACT7_05080 [soil metagenome]